MNTQPNLKTNPRSRLKSLPSERQEEIAAYSRTHSTLETARWLRAHGIRASASDVSHFLAWFRLGKQFQERIDTLQALLNMLRSEPLPLSLKELQLLNEYFLAELSLSFLTPLMQRQLWKMIEQARSSPPAFSNN